MTEDPVAQADAASATRHEDIKTTVGDDVENRITEVAAVPTPATEAKVANVAARIRDNSLDEAARGESIVGRARAAARGSQFIDYGFGLLYGLLAIRLVLAMIAATSSNGFVKFITAVTNPFYAPFKGIVSSPTGTGGHTFVVPLLIAIVVYGLLHASITGMLRMVGSHKTAI